MFTKYALFSSLSTALSNTVRSIHLYGKHPNSSLNWAKFLFIITPDFYGKKCLLPNPLIFVRAEVAKMQVKIKLIKFCRGRIKQACRKCCDLSSLNYRQLLNAILSVRPSRQGRPQRPSISNPAQAKGWHTSMVISAPMHLRYSNMWKGICRCRLFRKPYKSCR